MPNAIPQRLAKPQSPLKLEPRAPMRQGVDVSPSRSSIQSNSSNSRVHTPSSSVPGTPLISTRSSSPEKDTSRPADSSTILTALATQERRVLELKEELQKAESHLGRLKKQWAAHEAARKKNELQHSEQLQTLKTSLAAPGRQLEPIQAARGLDRRNVGLSNTRPSQRKVFSGSRHIRALSLLSPKDSSSRTQLTADNEHDSSIVQQNTGIGVPSTISEISRPRDVRSRSGENHVSSDKDAILETGKQLVGDLRQGVWRFIEDLKQVTVGEESSEASDRATSHAPGHKLRKPMKTRASTAEEKVNTKHSNAATLNASRKQYDNCTAPWQESDTPQQSHQEHNQDLDVITAGTSLVNTDSSESDDGWDNWDCRDDSQDTKITTLQHDTGRQACEPMTSPLTEGSSPSTSMW